MNRRSWLRLATLAGAAGLLPRSRRLMAADQAAGARPIVLYCDLPVDPAREQEMLDAYHKHFKPVAERHPGYIDLKIVKLRKVIQGGPAPAASINYRFQLTYQSEALRQKWIASEPHRNNWPLIENTLTDKGYLVLLTDAV
jgi:hypothetical protein